MKSVRLFVGIFAANSIKERGKFVFRHGKAHVLSNGRMQDDTEANPHSSTGHRSSNSIVRRVLCFMLSFDRNDRVADR